MAYPKTIKLNGLSVEELVYKNGYKLSYPQVEGPNSGTMLSGLSRYDILRTLHSLSITFNPMSEDQAAPVLRICNTGVISVYFWDIATQSYLTLDMRTASPEVSPQLVSVGYTWVESDVQFTECTNADGGETVISKIGLERIVSVRSTDLIGSCCRASSLSGDGWRSITHRNRFSHCQDP